MTAAARFLLLAALARVMALAAPAPTKTMLVSPVTSPETAKKLEAAARSWLQDQGSDGSVRITHLTAVRVATLDGIPPEKADALMARLEGSFGTTQEGKPRHFEWDGTVSIAGGGVSVGAFGTER
mmetsp:Transcript_109402/g.353196  ORF Transcript_109402/g.353196 Transcript_109402/m.353196 type:complete len:125 (-) Transcript_109402:168-542(-)